MDTPDSYAKTGASLHAFARTIADHHDVECVAGHLGELTADLRGAALGGVVQQLVTPVPEQFLDPAGDPSPQHVNYGVFVIGGEFGGGYLRAAPAASDTVIASSRGAAGGCVFVEADWRNGVAEAGA